ncbi:hypothetical protein ACLKA6_016589 [Drosophila palustris]
MFDKKTIEEKNWEVEEKDCNYNVKEENLNYSENLIRLRGGSKEALWKHTIKEQKEQELHSQLDTKAVLMATHYSKSRAQIFKRDKQPA